MTTWSTGAMPAAVSVRARRYRSYTGVNWRIVEGYGTLMERLAEGLPIRLGCAVDRVDLTGPSVVVRAGDMTARAAAVVLTVPASVLAAGAIRFDPALPHEKLRTLMGLPLGVNDKIYFDLPDGLAGLPQDTHFVGSLTTPQTGSYQVQPMGRPLLEMFLGADLAIALETSGPEAMASFAAEEIASVFGAKTVPKLRPVRWSGWLKDPFSRGAYSYARPGAAEQRKVLAEPVQDRLFFAGEACSPHWHSTVHGAWVTGQEAAAAALGQAAA
jgi:monoamine oxidase